MIGLIGAKIAGWVSPWIIAGVLAVALTGLWIWDRHTIDSLRAEKVAAIERADMASQDAARWAKAAEDRRAAIDRLNAEVEASRADLAQAEAILRTADDLARQEAQDLNAEIAKWKERARANPQDARPIGPIARDAYCHVMRGAGQVPAGCPAAD